MSLLGILFDSGKSTVSMFSGPVSIELDVTIDESHEWTLDVTTNPVETGAPISDHIQELPDRLTITGMITNTPLTGSIIDIFSNAFQSLIDGKGNDDRVKTTFDLLRTMYEQRELVNVYTKYRIYENMALTSINIPRSSGIGDAINFTAQFMHIRIVDTQTTDIPSGISKKKDSKSTDSVKKKASPTSKSGAKSNSPVTGEPKSTSVLKGITG